MRSVAVSSLSALTLRLSGLIIKAAAVAHDQAVSFVPRCITSPVLLGLRWYRFTSNNRNPRQRKIRTSSRLSTRAGALR
jgi:hypothetical protein